MGSKRSIRIAARKSRSKSNGAQSDNDGEGDLDSESRKCDGDGESEFSSLGIGGIGKAFELATTDLSLPVAKNRASSARWGQGKANLDSHRRRSLEKLINSDKISNKDTSTMAKLTSFFRRTEKQSSPEEVDESRKRMRTTANLSGESKRSKIPSSDVCSSLSVVDNALSEASNNALRSLGV